MDDVKLLNLTGITWDKIKSQRSSNPERLINGRPRSANDGGGQGFQEETDADDDEKISCSVVRLPQIIEHKLPKRLFEKKKPKVPRQKVKPLIAWPESSISDYGDAEKSINIDSLRATKQLPNKAIPLKIRTMGRMDVMATRLYDLQNKTLAFTEDENTTRSQLLQNADEMVTALPLNYLYSKVELRKYSVQRMYRIFAKPAKLRLSAVMRFYFQRWRYPQVVHISSLSENQIGFLVISKALSGLYKSALRRKFDKWSLCYSTRFNAIRAIRPNEAATEIQRWYRDIRITRSNPFRKFAEAVILCLHRRRAIKHIVRYEYARRQALDKVRKGVALRRRLFFAARSIQRVYRWVCLYRKTQWRLTRLHAIRKLQKWRRKTLKRKACDLIVLRLLCRCGGYSRVMAKLKRTKQSRHRIIEGANLTVTQIQKAWYQSKGQMALYMAFAARKAKLAYEQMRNDKATMIQNNYRAHLWKQLVRAAISNNRARRIQRGFRAHQYRAWMAIVIHRSRHRKAFKIQKCARLRRWRKILHARFKLRKSMIIFGRAKKTVKAIYIQRAWRVHFARVLAYREEMRKFFAQQRARISAVVGYVSLVQRNWRQIQLINSFPYHVKLLCQRLYREKRRKLNKSAFSIQKLAREYNRKIAETRRQLHTLHANIIWRCAKALLLRQALQDRVLATRERKRVASNRMKKNFRLALWWRIMSIRFTLMRARIVRQRECVAAATVLQTFRRRKVAEYNMAMRIAGRRQLHKKRMREAADQWWKKQHKSACTITKLFRGNRSWNRTVRLLRREKQAHMERRASKVIFKFCSMILAWQRFRNAVIAKNARKEAERILRLETKATNTIGFYWKRKKEKDTLGVRFQLRRQMIDVYNHLKSEREEAEEKRDHAIEEKRQTDENMQVTINASWKQGSDTEGRNYYYNFVTGASSWVPPPNWKMKVLDQWIRNIDQRGSVYYYNQQTSESRWLPPCAICGQESHKYCSDCGVAYCEPDYDRNHAEDADETMQNHAWSLTEYEKDKLLPGEVYCIECKRRAAKCMCTSCWDVYCDDCFKFVHHIGALRAHKSIAYKKAKKGWMCVRARLPGESDYYVHGTTGETKYEKPEELMTDQERIYYENFKQHQAAAEEQVKQIEKLQYDLEAANYERDTILFEALQGGGNLTNVLKKRGKGAAGEAVQEDVLKSAKKSGGFLSLFSGVSADYKQKILRPSERPRGKPQSDYLKELIEKAGADK